MGDAIPLFTAVGVAFTAVGVAVLLYLQLKMYRMLERAEPAIEQKPAASFGSWLEAVGLTSERLAVAALKADQSLNAFCVHALEKEINR